MKNYLLPFTLFLILQGCQPKKVMTYEMGLEQCKSLVDGISSIGLFPNIDCLEGFNLPTFSAITNQNDTISTNSLMGKPSIINLWFVGCQPCEAEVPGLNHLANKYNEQANFIAIGRNSDKYLTTFLDQHEWNFKHINDPKELLIRKSFQHKWGYPTTFITNKEGTIVKAFSGGKTDSTAVETIIQEIEPTLQELLMEDSHE